MDIKPVGGRRTTECKMPVFRGMRAFEHSYVPKDFIWRKVKKLEKMKLIQVEIVKGKGRTRRISCREPYRCFIGEFNS